MANNTISLLSEQSKSKYSFRGVVSRIVYLGFGYFFIFISELTFLSLVTQLYDQMDFKYLGNISVFVIYTFFGLGNFISSYIADKFSIKWIQFVCSLILTGFISMGILVSSCSEISDEDYFICKKPLIYTLVITITALAGVTSAVLWTAQSGFMMFFCKLYPEKEGQLIGIFWGIFQLSQGLGSLVAFILLKYFSETIFLVFMTAIAGFGAFMLFFYEDVPLHIIKKEHTISLTSLGSHALSETTRKKIKEFKRLFLSPDIRPYFPFFFMNGVVIAFYSSYLYTIVQTSLGYSLDSASLSEEEKQDINIKTIYVFTVLGFSEILAAAVCGKLMDKMHYTKVGYFANIIVQLGVIFSFASYFLSSYPLCFVCGFLWGFADCFIVSVASYICQVKFHGQIESFSIFRLFQGFGVMITVLISIFMSSLDQYFFIFVILCFQVISSTLMLSQFNENGSQFEMIIKEQTLEDDCMQQLDLKGTYKKSTFNGHFPS